MKRLTKSQYEEIARTININIYAYDIRPENESYIAMDIARDLAVKFAKYDTEFDEKKFLALCGITD